MRDTEPSMEDRSFAEFRRKVRHNEILQATIEKLLRSLRFSGRLSVIVKNGTILKSGYEEGYFTRREDERLIP
jgi:sulfur carrier protein ThiS